MQDKHRVAFAGMRHGHVTSLYGKFSERDDIEICGAYEEDDCARAKASEKGIDFSYDSLDSLVRDERVDTVVVGDCYAYRGKAAIKALESGKNVLADKPLCTEPEELDRIRELASEKNLTVGILLSLRYSGNVITAGKLIESGRIGKINNIVFEGEHPLNYGGRPDWYFKDGCHGGVITDIAVHGIDLVRIFTGSNIRKVNAARCWNFYADREPDFKDSAQFMAELESGAGIIADVSYSAPNAHGYSHPAYWHFRIFGDKGMLDFKADGTGVDMYLSDCSEVIHVESESGNGDETCEFFDAADNTISSEAYTSFILESMKETILIQKFADREEK